MISDFWCMIYLQMLKLYKNQTCCFFVRYNIQWVLLSSEEIYRNTMSKVPRIDFVWYFLLRWYGGKAQIPLKHLGIWWIHTWPMVTSEENGWRLKIHEIFLLIKDHMVNFYEVTWYENGWIIDIFNLEIMEFFVELTNKSGWVGLAIWCFFFGGSGLVAKEFFRRNHWSKGFLVYQVYISSIMYQSYTNNDYLQ